MCVQHWKEIFCLCVWSQLISVVKDLTFPCSVRAHYTCCSDALRSCLSAVHHQPLPCCVLAVESVFKLLFAVILIFMVILCILVILLCMWNNLLLCKFENGKKLFFVGWCDCRVVSWCPVFLICISAPEVLVVPVHQEYRARTKVSPHYWCNSRALWRQIPSGVSPLKCGAFPLDGGSALGWGELE